MQEPTPKPLELVQAQIAAFAAERVVHHEHKRHLLSNLGALATEAPEEVTRTTTEPEYHAGEGDSRVRVPEGTELTVATKGAYLEFLRDVGGSRYEAIQRRADMLQAYQDFAPAIDKLREELADPATRLDHPALIGKGSNAMVFSLEHNGKTYAVRVPRGGVQPRVIDDYLAGGVLSKGLPHLEQIVATSYETGVTVSELMPGKEIGGLNVDDISAITDDQLGEFVDTLLTANAHNIDIDPKPSNFFYDREEGFGIVDCHSANVAGKTSLHQTHAQLATWAAGALTNSGFYGRPYKATKTPEDYAHDLPIMQANLAVLKRYQAVVGGKLSGDERTEALEQISERIESAEELAQNYANPHWVAEEVADAAARQRRRKEQATQPLEITETGDVRVPLDIV